MAEVSRSQPVLTPLTEAAIFLVVTVEPGGEDDVRDLLADVAGLSARSDSASRTASCPASSGSARTLWDRLFGGSAPGRAAPVPAIAGPRHVAVATPGDLLFHIRARRMDLCFELADQLMRRLAGAVDRRRRGARLPVLRRAGPARLRRRHREPRRAPAAARGGAHRRRGPGLRRRQLRDRAEVPARPDRLERDARSRSRSGSSAGPSSTDIELPRRDQAGQLARGAEHHRRRRRRPNARSCATTCRSAASAHGEFGTYFIGYAGDPDVTEQMLQQHVHRQTAGQHDRILDFSTAVTGCLFFVPTADFLDDPPAATAARRPRPTVAAARLPPSHSRRHRPDDSLRIGSLRRSAAS